VVALLSVLVTVKLVNIQVISPDRYLNLGTNQRVKMDDLPGPRGTIRDRNGVDLALSVQMVTLIADPKR
jgi:cell division protein FtsI/penicillin-binding protein 2